MKAYYVIEKLDHSLEYIITEVDTNKGIQYQLYRSMNSTWSENSKGELLVTLVDEGNGYKFKHNRRNKTILDYDEIEHLYLLINHVRNNENMNVYNVCRYE